MKRFKIEQSTADIVLKSFYEPFWMLRLRAA